MLTPIHDPLKGKLRIAGFASGSGNTLWKVLELQKELEKTPEGSPFEVVGVFSDDPASKAIETAQKYGFPNASLDLRAFHKERNAPLRDREVRAEFDRQVMDLIAPFRADLILLAGYVWATTHVVVDRYRVVNVHPADLSVEKDGKRAFAGAHGIRDAVDAGVDELHSSSHVATKQLDGGPLLMVSPGVPVDQANGLKGDEGERFYLSAVNNQSRQIAARTMWEIARGAFQEDSDGHIYYQGQPVPKGVRLASWDTHIPLFKRDTAAFIHPTSVAVIGASARGGIGHAIVHNLLAGGYKGTTWAVNRKGEPVLGAMGFTSVQDIPENVEMAVLAVPSGAVLEAAEACGQKGVKTLVCVSAGFKEVGGDGIQREQDLMAIVNRYNMRILGPNCMGIANTDPDVCLYANILQSAPPRGGIGFLTQSGALGAAMVDFAESLGLGFSIIASLGNQADMTACDFLPLLAADPQTKVILLYMETIPEPARFARLVRSISPQKPVVIMKAGRTEAGAAAASSHTGSLAGNDQVAAALLAQCGAIRVDTLAEAFGLAGALSTMPVPKGRRVGVVTNAGGPGILVADGLHQRGFTMPLLPDAARAALQEMLLPEASTGNPVDLVAPARPDQYAAAVAAMLADGGYDALLLICVPPATIDTGKVAEAVVTELKSAKIPVLTCFFGPTLGLAGRQVMLDAGIPSVTFPEQLAEILTMMMKQKPVESLTDEAHPVIPHLPVSIRDAVSAAIPGSYLSPALCQEILQLHGFETVRAQMVETPHEVNDIQFNYPVVAKIHHPDVIHKSDAGGVILGIPHLEAARQTVADLLARFPGALGVEIQEQIPAGIELILGAVKDPAYGHGIMVGLGGTAVEIYKDIAFAHAPLTQSQAITQIESLKGYPILQGYRGKPGVNVPALADLMVRLGQLVLNVPQITELDLNPLIYDPVAARFVVVDYRMRLQD